MKKVLSIVMALSLFVSLSLVGAGCDTTVSANTGTIEVRVTDAPPEYDIATIDITFSEVAIHTSFDDGDGEWIYITIVDGSLDLLQLQDGVDALLATGIVTAGNYTQLRVIIDTIAVTLNNDEEPPEVKLPSGELKLIRPFEVTEGETTILLLDFIASESIITTGAGKIIFKPVVKLTVDNTACAKVSGTVFNDLDGNGTQDTEEPGLADWTIYIDQNLNGEFDDGEITVTSDSDGKYKFVGLEPGTYVIREVVEPGWLQTWPLDGYYNETLEEGQSYPDNNFGNKQE